VRTIAAPDPAAADPTAEGERLAAELRAAVVELDAEGIGFAAFLADTIFSSDGIVADPAGFLRPLADAVRECGGLFVADEVQAGFARSGEAFWTFRRHGIEPDLVTMGKPMGNGMPIAAVAGPAELLDDFGGEVRYFNTFGGSSVSIAAATAVLDVIEEEGLQENAAAVGAYLRAGLEEAARRSPLLGRVRGVGLFLGVDVEAGDGDAARSAARIVEGLRDRRVLISVTGAGADTLKIRPPLVFSRADADRLLSALGDVLDEP
jgi:4-aminobutyrate aminotransferase-like enzyme